jgi:hypothetical protein
MAQAQHRSMNQSLHQGACIDGKYKQVRPDTELGYDPEGTYRARNDLSLPYYGFGQPSEHCGRPVPNFYPNTLEEASHGPTLGKTW